MYFNLPFPACNVWYYRWLYMYNSVLLSNWAVFVHPGTGIFTDEIFENWILTCLLRKLHTNRQHSYHQTILTLVRMHVQTFVQMMSMLFHKCASNIHMLSNTCARWCSCVLMMFNTYVLLHLCQMMKTCSSVVLHLC